MEERRKEDRKTLIAFTPVYDLYQGTLLGNLADLNLLGVMVIGERALEIDREVTLAIQLPDDLPASITASRITIPARVAWCKQDVSPEYYNIGFEFKELKARHEAVIKEILDKYQFRRDIPPAVIS
jgi:hypothetical protein